MNKTLAIFAGIGCWAVALILSTFTHDWQMIAFLVRVCVAVPVALALMIVGILAVDACTPENWLEEISKDVQAKALVLVAVIASVAYVVVNG